MKRNVDRTPARSRASPSSKAVSTSSSATYRLPWLLMGGVAMMAVALFVAGLFVWDDYAVRRATREAVGKAQRGRFAQVESQLRLAFQRDASDIEVVKALAIGLTAKGQSSEAEPILLRWAVACPQDPAPLRLLMDLHHGMARKLKLGEAQEQQERVARDFGMKVLQLASDDSATAQKVVWLCLGLGELEEAMRVCQEQLELHTSDPDLLYLQARVFLAQGEQKSAARVLDQLLISQPHFSSGMFLRGVLYFEAGDAERAIPLLQSVVAEQGSQAKEARYHLGLALAAAGRSAEAKQLLAEIQLDNLEHETVRPGERDGLAVRVRRAELLAECGRVAEARAILQQVLAEQPAHAGAVKLLQTDARQPGSVAGFPNPKQTSSASLGTQP